MCKLSSLLILAVVMITSTVQADTIHLKNGSLLKGKVTSFADDQFVVMLDTGSGRYMSRAMVYIGDVARIEFDAAAGQDGASGPASDAASAPSPSRTAAPRVDMADSPPRAGSAADSSSRASATPDSLPRAGSTPDSAPRSSSSGDASPRNSSVDAQPRDAASVAAKSASAPPRDPDAAQPDKPASSSPSISDTPEVDRAPVRKPAGPVRTATVDVSGKRDWTSTGLIVKRGDRIRITASGNVTLDPTSGRTAGPDGIPDLPDPKKLMPDKATGALIGVIGADNDDFIFVGGAAEFTAARDGLLFLSVNEGNLADNTGAYRAVIEVQLQRK